MFKLAFATALGVLATTAHALTYMGQSYVVTIYEPGPDSPWYTGGYNMFNISVIQTLICCPPLPPVNWVLRNNNTSLISQDVTVASTGDFNPADNPPIAEARAGSGYVLYAVLATDPSQTFGQSEPFDILEGAISAPIISASEGPSTSTLDDSVSATNGVPDTSPSASVTATTSAASSAPTKVGPSNSASGGASGSATSPTSRSASVTTSKSASSASSAPSPTGTSGDLRAAQAPGVLVLGAVAAALL